MKILYYYWISFLFAPLLGSIIAYQTNRRILGYVELSFLINYIVHLTIVVVIAAIVLNKRRTVERRSIDEAPDVRININNSVRRLTVVLFLVVLFMFVVAGRHVLLGGAHRGDVRISLGAFGALYSFCMIYLVPGLFALTAVIATKYGYALWRSPRFMFLVGMVLLAGIMTGYKFTVILMLIPGAAILVRRISLKKALLGLGVLYVLIFANTVYIEKRSVGEATNYITARMTTVAAYGVVGAWNTLDPNGQIGDASRSLLRVFGSSLASKITGVPTTDQEFLYLNLSRLVTFRIYPDVDKALSGATNLTVANFGEAIYFFGRGFYWIYSVLAGLIAGYVFSKLRVMHTLIHPVLYPICAVYLVSVVVPWFNSTGIVSLISLPTFFYMAALLFVLNYVVYGYLGMTPRRTAETKTTGRARSFRPAR